MKNPLNIICISDEKDFFFYYSQNYRSGYQAQ